MRALAAALTAIGMLAKAGYVVLTFDPQGQGQSDVPGEGADAQEGVPAQTDGRPFFDGTEDAAYYRSRLDIDGFACEDLRAGCPGMEGDGGGEYSYLGPATSPDAGTG